MSETMVERCPRFGKWIGGCRFEARYDEKLPDGKIKLGPYRMTQTLEAMKKRIYVADVCIRCGKSVRRDAALSEGEQG